MVVEDFGAKFAGAESKRGTQTVELSVQLQRDFR